jgi:hypothetical protein
VQEESRNHKKQTPGKRPVAPASPTGICTGR